jgi:hypothetical protein
MVGIYSKIKNGLNWLQNTPLKNILPILGKVGDVANSDLLNSLLTVATPALNTLVPGLGPGLGETRKFLGKGGTMANDVCDNNNYQSRPRPTVISKRPDQLQERIQLKSLPDSSGPNIEEVD